MLSILTWILLLVVIVGTVFLVIAIANRNNENDKQTLLARGITTPCTTNQDCNLGYICELVDHPSIGKCKIAQGGNCSEYEGREDICYTGYYCDKDEHACLRKI